MAFYHGKSGSVKLGGSATTMPVKSWKAKVDKGEQDTSNTTSGGWREFQAGLKVVEATIEAEWDATLHPFAAPIDVQTNDTVATKLRTLSSDVTPTLDFTGFVSSVDIDCSVENIIKYTLNIKSSGAVTFAG